MSLNKIIKLPIVPMARISDGITRNEMSFDEVIYDYNTMSYKTKSQQIEIENLQKQLLEKDIKRKKDLKNIVSYFYKRN